MQWCMKRGMAMFTSPGDHHRCLLAEVVHNLQQQPKDPPPAAFVLLRASSFSIRPGAGSSGRRGSRLAPQSRLQLRGFGQDGDGSGGVSRAGTESCIAPTVPSAR